MPRKYCVLALAAACLLAASASRAEARQPRRLPPRPIYAPVRPVPPGVYVFPQVRPAYSPMLPYGGWNPYPPVWYGGYTYAPGSFRYSVTPWGSSYSYSTPGYYWYRAW